VPIVVLTDTNDEELALSCIDAGAQDFLCKSEITANSLRRAIGFAVNRSRETQLRQLRDSLLAYQELASANGDVDTAAADNTVPMRRRKPRTFGQLVRDYEKLLEACHEPNALKSEESRQLMQQFSHCLGDAAAGPHDLADVHLTALKQAAAECSPSRARSLAVEGWLLSLEMMGLLVDYYRVKQRRRSRASV